MFFYVVFLLLQLIRLQTSVISEMVRLTLAPAGFFIYKHYFMFNLFLFIIHQVSLLEMTPHASVCVYVGSDLSR